MKFKDDKNEKLIEEAREKWKKAVTQLEGNKIRREERRERQAWLEYQFLQGKYGGKE